MARVDLEQSVSYWKQAGFAVPHSSLTIGLVGVGLGLGRVGVGVGSKKSRRSGGGWDERKIMPLGPNQQVFPTGPSVAKSNKSGGSTL